VRALVTVSHRSAVDALLSESTRSRARGHPASLRLGPAEVGRGGARSWSACAPRVGSARRALFAGQLRRPLPSPSFPTADSLSGSGGQSDGTSDVPARRPQPASRYCRGDLPRGGGGEPAPARASPRSRRGGDLRRITTGRACAPDAYVANLWRAAISPASSYSLARGARRSRPLPALKGLSLVCFQFRRPRRSRRVGVREFFLFGTIFTGSRSRCWRR